MTSCAPPGPSKKMPTANAAGSALLNEVVQPAVAQAEKAFSTALARINVDDLVKKAEPFRDIAWQQVAENTIRKSQRAAHCCNTIAPPPRSRSGLFRRDSAWG